MHQQHDHATSYGTAATTSVQEAGEHGARATIKLQGLRQGGGSHTGYSTKRLGVMKDAMDNWRVGQSWRFGRDRDKQTATKTMKTGLLKPFRLVCV
jgi:hypothetical protein